MVELWVDSQPEPWSRPRPRRGWRRGMAGRGYYTPASSFRSCVTAVAMMSRSRPRPHFVGPVGIIALFLVSRKTGELGLFGKKPDLDNLEKNLLDGLEDAGYFEVGDQQVALVIKAKARVRPGQEGCLVQAFELSGPRP